MKENTLSIHISKPLHNVFEFATMPPNSSKWIPGVVDESTNEWPVREGTVYRLTRKGGKWFEVVVTAFQPDKLVEWSSPDGSFHCRYTFKALPGINTELRYDEWVDNGTLDDPFTLQILEKFKQIVEAP